MDFELVAEGLAFPEGPIAMADGSILVVEIAAGCLTRLWGNGKSETVAVIGGGPNGAALGPDGAVYVCNNGGFTWIDIAGLRIPTIAAADYAGGRIERVDLNTGRVERLYDHVGGNALSGPNDLVFAKDGGFWFTDLGKVWPRSRDHGGLYWAKPDGSGILEAAYGPGYNGVGLSPDEKHLYCAETLTGRLWEMEITGPGQIAQGAFGAHGRCMASLPGFQMLDSLAVEADGRVCVATLVQGGITAFSRNGHLEQTPFPDPLVTNICFGGTDACDAFITLSASGKLIRARWPRPGLALNFST